jgi:hypothetical protein
VTCACRVVGYEHGSSVLQSGNTQGESWLPWWVAKAFPQLLQLYCIPCLLEFTTEGFLKYQCVRLPTRHSDFLGLDFLKSSSGDFKCAKHSSK